jgi:hypothetical protein
MRKTEVNCPKTHNLPSSSQLETVARVQSLRERGGVFVPPVSPDKVLVRRYELKYRISEPTAQAVKGFISAFLSPDPYTRRWPDGQYPICSLYLDSKRLDLFQETLVDKCNRFKLRIRGYDDESDGFVYFEIKRKLNRIIYKSRAKVIKTQAAEVLRGHFLPPQATEADHAILRQFVHYTHCLMARPVVLVRYKREAFESYTDARVRVTFDRQLSYQKTDKLIFKPNGQGWKKLPIDFVILEIKFTGWFPSWLAEMARLFNLNRQSMSKYCRSVQQLVPAGVEFPSSW